MGRKPGAKVKLLLIGGLVGVVKSGKSPLSIFSLATFFAVNAKALEGRLRKRQRMTTKARKTKGTLDESAKETWLEPRGPHLPQKNKSRKSKGGLR